MNNKLFECIKRKSIKIQFNFIKKSYLVTFGFELLCEGKKIAYMSIHIFFLPLHMYVYKLICDFPIFSVGFIYPLKDFRCSVVDMIIFGNSVGKFARKSFPSCRTSSIYLKTSVKFTLGD